MPRIWIPLILSALALPLGAGCSSSDEPAEGLSVDSVAASPSSEFLLAAEPPGATDVAQTRASAQDGEPIVVVGQVGGDKQPFVQGVAAFLIVDSKMSPCPADCGCPTPWDFCCDLDELAAKKAMVKVVDESDQVVAIDARQLLGIKELTTVVVQGRAKRDQAGNLTLLADGVFPRP
jgi:hypothetical protein